jgi:hypothetical protein
LLVIADAESTGDAPLMAAAWYLDQIVHRVLGLAKTAAVLLVLPDGHLAFRGSPSDLPRLVNHVPTFAVGSSNR